MGLRAVSRLVALLLVLAAGLVALAGAGPAGREAACVQLPAGSWLEREYCR